MLIPDLGEHREADGEGGKAFDDVEQIVKSVRHFQRDDQQGDGEGEDGIAEGFEAGNLSRAPLEALLSFG